MEEEFVPYNLALKLKELGFNELCFAGFRDSEWFGTDGPNSRYFHAQLFKNSQFDKDQKDCCSSPTFSQVFRWFREKHRIITEIRFYNNGEDWEDTEFTVTVNRFEDFATHNTFVKNDIKSYEEAELICLEKLIEIVKDKF